MRSTVVDVDAYLARIGVEGLVELDREGLERLQRAHLTTVPFENLDVFYRRGVKTGVDWSVPKITDRGRGGWCFELNGAFAALLETLGFPVIRLGARVLDGDDEPDVPDHLTIEVRLERPYLVDVGFGDTFIKPLPLDSEGPHDGGVGPFGFVFEGDDVTLVEFTVAGEPVPQYRFDRTPRKTDAFDAPSRRLQTQAGLHWTERRFATRLLDGGPDRVTLLEDRIKFRRDGAWVEQPVPDDEWAATLGEWFGMTP